MEQSVKVFSIEVAEGYELIQPIDEDQGALLDELIDGTPRGSEWAPAPPMRLISKGEHRRPLQRSDAPWLGRNILVLRPEAAEVLKPLLTQCGELLPLSCEQARLFAFNTFHVVDALNEDASTVDRLDDGRIWWIDKYVFHGAAIQGLKAFKLTSLQPSPLFVGEEFVKRWHAAGLKGLDFKQVWEG